MGRCARLLFPATAGVTLAFLEIGCPSDFHDFVPEAGTGPDVGVAENSSDGGSEAGINDASGSEDSHLEASPTDGGALDVGVGDSTGDSMARDVQAADGCSGLVCDGGCVQNDRYNCGACGNDCTALPNVSALGLTCSAGRCVYTCASGFADCADAGRGCSDNTTLNGNCGACGVTCASPTPLCAGSTCSSSCSGSAPNLCGMTCTNTQNDPSNCGSCGKVCSRDAGADKCLQSYSCQQGGCVGSNPVSCTAMDPCHAAGTCDPATGACSNPAQPNGTACGASGSGLQCQTGTCVCSNSSYTNCSGTCTDTTTDFNNCGACGKACPNLVSPNSYDTSTTNPPCNNGTCVGGWIGENAGISTVINVSTSVIYATKAHSPSQFTFTGLSVQPSATTTGSCTFIAGVYNDSGSGAPGTLLGSSITHAWSDGSMYPTLIFPYSAGSFPAGDYWIALRFSCSTQNMATISRAGAVCAGASDASGTLPQTWPATAASCSPLRTWFVANFPAQ